MMTCNNYLRIFVLMTVLLMTGCARSTAMLPITIQSDPLGAYVLMQQQDAKQAEPHWIYLGNTPLSAQHLAIQDQGLVLRVMKEGYFDQTRQWQPDQLQIEVEEKKKVFWNPRLVPSGQK